MKPSIFSPLRGSRSSREPQPSDHSAAPLTKISAPVASLEQLRAQILERITRAVVILAAVIVLVNLPNIFRTQRWGALFVFAGLEAVLILSGFSKRLSYPLRMAVFMGTVYLAGVLVLLNNGLNGPGRVILVGVPIFATLLGGAAGAVYRCGAEHDSHAGGRRPGRNRDNSIHGPKPRLQCAGAVVNRHCFRGFGGAYRHGRFWYVGRWLKDQP